MPKNCPSGQMYTAMYRGPDTPIENIPEWAPEYCKGIRVMIRYSELQKSLAFCRALAEKGYSVFIQPSVTARYTEEEIQTLIRAANEMQAYALYFVDTYGYLQPQDIRDFFRRYDANLDASVRIGFHAHNNQMLALPNALEFLTIHTERQLILDACLLGFGQGAGNLQTEIITNYMNVHNNAHYEYGAVLDGCEIMESFCGRGMSGYSVTQLLPALHRTAYRYSVALRDGYGLTYREIDRILKRIPEELRHRYTPEHTVQLLTLCGYPVQEAQAK